MKRINMTIAAVAASLSFAFTACSDLDIEKPMADNIDPEPELIENGDMQVTFNCTMEDTDATRTEFHDKTIWWSKGDAINFYQRYIKTAGSSYSTGYVGRTLDDSAQSYSTNINFTKPAEFPAYYWALYPAGSVAYSRTTLTGETILYASMTVPAEQNPSLTSFDPAADVLVSEYIEAREKQTTFNMRFRRVVALGKMTIKNLPSASEIKSIKFENDKSYLAGTGWYELENAATRPSVQSGTSSYSITMNYTEPVTANSASGMTAYFTCRAFTLSEGKSFTVTVTTANGEIFTKKVTIPAGREIKFEEGKGTRFNVDMSTADKTCEWLSLSPYSSGSYVPTIEKTYAGLKGSDIASVKWCTADMATFSGITDINAYIESKGTDLSSTYITSLNSGTTLPLPKTGTIDTEYAFLVKATNNAGQSVILTTTARTDWFKIAAVTRPSGGIQVQLTGIGLDPAKCRNYRVAATEDLPASTADYETYYTGTLSPGTSPSLIESINANNGTASYNLGVTKYYTDKTNQAAMVSEKNYTALMKVVNTRGESKFVYASANAK